MQRVIIIDRCFVKLKARIPILQYKVRLTQAKISKLIISCIVLHNVEKFLGDKEFPFQEELHTFKKKGKVGRFL